MDTKGDSYMRALRLVLGLGLLALPLGAVIVERVAIKVNDDIITQYDITQLEQDMRTEFQRSGRAIPANFRQQVTDQLVNDRLVAQLAKKEGIIVTQIEVEERINYMMKAQSMDADTFKASLAREGVQYDSFYEQMKKKITMQKLFSKSAISASVSASDAEIEALYRKYAPEEFHLMHMYIPLAPQANFTQRGAAEEKIKKVEAALAQNPWSFGNTAAANNVTWRDWGWVLPGPDLPKYLIPAFTQLTWSGQIFSYRVVNEIPGFPGFHSLLLVNKRKVALDTVRDRLAAVVREEKLNEAIDGWLATLRKDAAIVYVP